MNPGSKCKLCKEEIKNGAVVCVHCGSFQNWKRHLNFSSIILSLLIAVFTILGFTYPYLKEKLQPPKTELKATLMGSSKDYLYLLVSNTGNRPGSIKEIILTDYSVAKKKVRHGISPKFQIIPLSEFEIIPPEDSRIIKISIKKAPLVFPTYLNDPELNKYKSVCTLRIDAVAFDGSATDKIDITYACVPYEFREQWRMEKISVDLNAEGLGMKEIQKHHPEFYKLIEEYMELSPPVNFFDDFEVDDEMFEPAK